MEEEFFLEALNQELVPALGCTEPVAIALAAATAIKYLKCKTVIDLKVFASNNIIKNAMAVVIPGTGSCGINLAAALGSFSRNEANCLEVLNGLNKDDITKAKSMIKDGLVSVNLAPSPKKLYIEVIIKTLESCSRVVIEDTHSNISLIEVDGKIIKSNFSEEVVDKENNYAFLCIDTIWDFIKSIDVHKLCIIKKSIEMNKKIGIYGLENSYGLQVGRTIKNGIDKNILGDDMANYAMALTSAGSDARMGGCLLSVMSNSGSGNQGITATLPVVAVWEKLLLSEEKLLRATVLSHLITIYIKSKFGRLSALCGVTIAAMGASCGITYLMEGDKGAVKSSIQNMIGNIAGIFCDGAKAGCALKVSTCTNAAVQSALLAINGICIRATDGIIDEDVEKTIENLCTLGNKGTVETDKLILNIMLNKQRC